MTAINQGDIGQCDDCGDPAEPRRRVLVEATVSGYRMVIAAWLCGPCEAHRVSAG